MGDFFGCGDVEKLTEWTKNVIMRKKNDLKKVLCVKKCARVLHM